MRPTPPLAQRVRETQSSAIRDLLTITARAQIVSLAGGLPDPELVPRQRIAEAADRALAQLGCVQYTETPGWAPLREVVAARESVRLSRPIGVDEIVVTHGSQQALALLGQALLDPGSLVIVEDPAYVGALQVFRAAGARIVAVPLDADGMRLDVLAERLAAGERPTVVHTVSNFHNPGSVTMSAARRVRLAALAEEYGFWVLEDDPYGELHFGTPVPEPVAAHTDRVIRLSSASKTLAPALRTGWLVAPVPVCRAVELLKQGADLCGSALTQQIAAELLADEAWFAGHLETVRQVYGQRCAALGAALDEAFGPVARRTRVDGGMFSWVDFLDDTDTTELLSTAVDFGVAYVPGSAFAVAGGYRSSMRLCFTTAEPAVLADAVGRLARAYAHSQS